MAFLLKKFFWNVFKENICVPTVVSLVQQAGKKRWLWVAERCNERKREIQHEINVNN